MTNYPPNTLDADDFDAMSIKELLAIGRYINTTKNGENDLVEEDFFDAIITRLSDLSEEEDGENDLELEVAMDTPGVADVCDSYGRPTQLGYLRSEENCTYRRSMGLPRDIRGCICRDGRGCRVDEARESDEERERIDNFIEEFSAQADVMGGDLGASMHEAIGIIERLRRDNRDEEQAVRERDRREVAAEREREERRIQESPF